VLELGSGASTVLIAYALEGLGAGRVVSLDHEPAYARRTEALITAHGLEAIASVRTAPLTAITLDGEAFSWYAPDACSGLGTIDLLMVDGPPGSLGSQARYPALPVLQPFLAPDAVILVDDGGRDDEAAVVKRWQAIDLRLTAEYVETEKGAYVLRRMPSAQAQFRP
jgi:predicted O-methyltransferase YrrM